MTTAQNVGDRWHREVAQPDWFDRVRSALLRSAEVGDHLGLPVTIVQVGRAADALQVVYRNQGHPGLLGVRRPLFEPPAVGAESEQTDLAEWLAQWVLGFEVGEPPGRRTAGVEPDADGITWWELPQDG